MQRFFKTSASILFAVLTVLAVAGMSVPAARAQSRASSEASSGGAILLNLPPHDSADYKALLTAAGNPRGEALEMTKSEMWAVSPERIKALSAAAAQHGVTVTTLNADWNHALAPMQAGAAMSDSQQKMMHDTMASKSVMGMSMMELPQASAVEYALTMGMHDKAGKVSQLVIPLKGDVTVTAERTSVTKTSDGYIWRGVVSGSDDLVTLMWWPGGRLTGTLSYKGHMYAVKHMGGMMHGVIEMSPDGLPPEHAPMESSTMKKMNFKVDPFVRNGDASMMRDAAAGSGSTPPASDNPKRPSNRDLEDAPLEKISSAAAPPAFITAKPFKDARKFPPALISVLLAYTKQAASYYSDIEKDLIGLAIADANQSFRNSGITNVRLDLVHAYQTDYKEDGSHFEHVFRFADKVDGYMDDVHALRERYKADVAILIVHDPHGCGLAAQVQAPADRAFAVVHHECAATTYSLSHEIGHLIGARHDEALDDSKDPFPFGHGYVYGKAWRTMMSYKESCDGCPRLPVWSNPNVKIRGVPAGSETSNNARVIAENASRVAAFRN
jgi:Metallo-peptidase family M12